MASTTRPSPAHCPAESQCLTALPEELLAAVVRLIPRPRDLASVSLVNRQFHRLGMATLYSSIEIDLTNPSMHHKVTAMLSPENPGLQHVEALKLSFDSDQMAAQPEALNVAEILITILPRNQRKSFSCSPTFLIRIPLLYILHMRQQKLEYVELPPTTGDGERSWMERLARSPLLMEGFKNVESINIFPHQKCDLKAAHAIIKAGRPLRSLKLSLANISNMPPEPVLAEDGTVSDYIFWNLFNHIRPFGDSCPMVLNSLTLVEVNLKYASKTYIKVLGFENLAVLEVRNCERADLFLTGLSHPSVGTPPKVRSFTISHKEAEGQTAIVAAVEDYLSSFKGLHCLKIHLKDVETLPAATQIIRHSDTLDTLYVEALADRGGYSNDRPHRYSLSDFQMLCEAVTNVVQLGIAFPFTNVAERFTLQFKDHLSAVTELPKLVTLIVTTWPEPSHHHSIALYTYNTLCQERATRAFDMFRDGQDEACGTDSLKVLAFGVKGNDHTLSGVLETLKRNVYYRGTLSDPFGVSVDHAVVCDESTLQYAVAEIDILQFQP
ncbi:MAG: hypothetical protein M1812_002142 [Candelaria pacifica]|nr:MAG: hypothetical protein M1812_002142 [Candelaria pacifica]